MLDNVFPETQKMRDAVLLPARHLRALWMSCAIRSHSDKYFQTA